MIKATYFLLIAIFIMSLSCKSKLANQNDKVIPFKNELNYIPYYLKMYKADSLFLTDNFADSYKILDSLFKIYPPIETDNYFEYSIYLNAAVMSGNLDSINKKVRYGYTHFGGISTLHKNNSKMKKGVNEAAHLSNVDIENLKKVYYISLETKLRNKLLFMQSEDQSVRNNSSSTNENIEAVDYKNRIALDTIFKKYGYPKKEFIGSSSAYDLPGGDIRLKIFFLHQPKEFKKKYLPIFFNNLKKGYSDPSIYTSVYDRMLMDSIGIQYYGTFDCEDEACPLSNPKEIDSIRSSVGLPHIKYYKWRLEQFGR